MASGMRHDPAGSCQINVGDHRANGGSFDPYSLGRLVEVEVIPRLLVAHSAPPHLPGETAPAISDVEVARFAPLALSLEAHVLLDEIETYLLRGVSVETIFVELLAPAARLLGAMWDEDRVDFIAVTMALWRLQEVLREVAARTPAIVNAAELPRSALFTPMPGEQHSFGASMVAECFARAGWDTELLVEALQAELFGRIAGERFDLVGVTISCDRNIERLRSLVTAIRNVSCNPEIRVMIGGWAATTNPEIALYVGADGTAPTATTAVAVADRLVETPRCAAMA